MAELHAPPSWFDLSGSSARARALFIADELATSTAWPAISRAAHALDLDALRRELAAGVAVDLLNTPDGRTPLQLACRVSNDTIIYQRGGTEVAFLNWTADAAELRRVTEELISRDRVACCALLLEHGASPNPGGSHYPPLMDAASTCSLATVNILLSAGSDPNALGRAGGSDSAPYFWSPLFLANSRGLNSAAVSDALLKAGADAKLVYAEKSLMQWAICRGHRHVYHLLLRGGAILPPTGENPFNDHPAARRFEWSYHSRRAHPYLQKIEAAGSWAAYEKAHRAKLLATFTPKFTHLVPASSPIVPLIVEYSFHLGFY